MFIQTMKLLPYILIVASFSACTKDKLKGEFAILKGDWEWVESFEISGCCSYYHATPDKNGSASFTFERNGSATIYRNDEVLREGRISFSSLYVVETNPGSTYLSFTIRKFYGRENWKYKYSGWVTVSGDTLHLQGFPYDNTTQGHNVFVRVK